jgi:acetyltransferase-like isoleucine patch superfamily enzyme
VNKTAEQALSGESQFTGAWLAIAITARPVHLSTHRRRQQNTWGSTVNMSGLNKTFLTADELQRFGFRKLGRNVLIHPTVVIVDCSAVSIGDHVRIDPFCVLSAKQIDIGSYVNIAAGSKLLGRARVVLEDFTTTAVGAMLFTSSDDYSGRGLVGPTVPEAFRGAQHGDVTIRRHGLIGAGSVVLTGVTIGEGSAVGALSFVNRSLASWGVYAGVPVRRIRDRAKDVLALEEKLKRHGSQLDSP